MKILKLHFNLQKFITIYLFVYCMQYNYDYGKVIMGKKKERKKY